MAIARRQVGGDQDFQRLEPFAAIDSRLEVRFRAGIHEIAAVLCQVAKTVNRSQAL